MAFRLTDFLSAAEKTMLCLLCFSYDSCCFKAAKCSPKLFGKIRRSAFAGELSAGKVLVEKVPAVKSLSVSVRRQKAFRQKVLREQAAGQTGLRRPSFRAKNRKCFFCLLYPRREAAAVSSRKMQLGWFCRTEAGHMGVTSPFTAFLTASAFDAPVAIRTIFFAFIMDCMPIVSA